MTIKMKKADTTLTVAVGGKLDTLSAPQLDEKVSAELEGVTKLIFDFKDLVYISSAGLRVLVAFAHTINDPNGIVIKNANEDVIGIFEVTGFIDSFIME